MNKPNILRIGATLLLGLLIGFAASALAFRYRLIRLPHESFIQRLDRILDLTPAQREEVSVIIDDTRDKIHDARRQFHRTRREDIRDARAKIRALLQPGQQTRFDKYFQLPAHLPRDVSRP